MLIIIIIIILIIIIKLQRTIHFPCRISYLFSPNDFVELHSALN